MAIADIDYNEVRRKLEERFAEIEKLHILDKIPVVPDEIARACGAVFSSNTQAYREVLLGCIRPPCKSTNQHSPAICRAGGVGI